MYLLPHSNSSCLLHLCTWRSQKYWTLTKRGDVGVVSAMRGNGQYYTLGLCPEIFMPVLQPEATGIEPKGTLTLLRFASHLLTHCLFHDMFSCLQENTPQRCSATQSPLSSPASLSALITAPFISAIGDSLAPRSLHALLSLGKSIALGLLSV